MPARRLFKGVTSAKSYKTEENAEKAASFVFPAMNLRYVIVPGPEGKFQVCFILSGDEFVSARAIVDRGFLVV